MGDVTVDLLRGFQTYLIEKAGNSPNTVHKRLRTIRTLLYHAIRDGRFPQEKNPFFQIKLKKEKVIKQRLDISEIHHIEQLDLEEGTLIWHVRNWFLFSFYAGGIRFSDVCLLKWDHIKNGRLSYKMKKTREGSSTILVPQALEIITTYRQSSTVSDDYVFPILKGYKTYPELEMHNSISSWNALVNKYLKKIQKKAGIRTSLSFHLARHSLADYLRRKGWSVYDISKILAHSNVIVTERYLKGFDKDDLDNKMLEAF